MLHQTDEVRIEVYNRLAKAEWDELRERNRQMKIQDADGTLHPMPEMPEWPIIRIIDHYEVGPDQEIRKSDLAKWK